MRAKITTLFFIVSLCAIHLFSQQAASLPRVQIVDGCPSKLLKAKIEKNASGLLYDIENSYKNNMDNIFFKNGEISEDAKKSINSIWSSSKFRCANSAIKERLLKTASGYEVRNIPIVMEESQEEIVLEFNESGVVSDMYFSVSRHQYKNISANNAVVDETKRNIIRDFLETLKTAYVKKDADFINMVLSDKALIIVGKSVKQTEQNSFKVTDTGKQLLYAGDNSSYKKMTKTEYMNGLKKVFKNNKNILVNFNDIEIIPHRKSGYESFYGVRLKQKWQTDNYSDYGILFFVIQFRDNDNPLIWVRVWQDANATTQSEQIGLGEIQIQPN